MTHFYSDLADWWPLFSPPVHYIEEVADLLQRLAPLRAPGTTTLLELGCGGGSFASHLKQQFTLTLTDLSEAMLAQSRAINPEAEHFSGDMRSLRLNQQFDYVLVHDAVCYMTTLDDLRAAMVTAAVHCRPGGTVIFLPDYVSETFSPGTKDGGEDAEDGRGFRYLEWRWDPDPSDNTYIADYAFLLREANGDVRVEQDRHIEGLFPPRGLAGGVPLRRTVRDERDRSVWPRRFYRHCASTTMTTFNDAQDCLFQNARSRSLGRMEGR